MNRVLLNMFLLASFMGMGQAITYAPLGGGLENNGYMTGLRTMFYDTIGKKLYASGQFKTAENKIVYGAAVWYNNSWDSLKGGFTQYPQQLSGPGTPSEFAWKIIRFQNKIYFGGGGIVWVDGKNQYNMGVWNGASWDYPLAQPPNSSVNDMIVHNGMLYACGEFTQFGNSLCNYIAKFDGTSWQPVGDFSKFGKTNTPGRMCALKFYNGELYVGGTFLDSLGMPRNIAKFDGTKWQNVGTGIRQGGISYVQCLEVFNNQLYIGGRFGRSQEIPGDGLVSWDGSNYVDISPISLEGGQINLFKKHKSRMAVMGNFTDYGSSNAYGLFYINESSPNQYCVINGLQSTWTNTLNYNWEACDFINDSLIVGGLFKYLDNVQANNIGVITNYETNSSCVAVGIENYKLDTQNIFLFPNPAKDILKIDVSNSEARNFHFAIYNIVGEQILSDTLQDQISSVDLRTFIPGLYVVEIRSDKGRNVFKIIKE